VSERESSGDDQEVVITEFGDCTVAHLPDSGEAWISGWVDVPR
jgi:hypothetical protein